MLVEKRERDKDLKKMGFHFKTPLLIILSFSPARAPHTHKGGPRTHGRARSLPPCSPPKPGRRPLQETLAHQVKPDPEPQQGGQQPRHPLGDARGGAVQADQVGL